MIIKIKLFDKIKFSVYLVSLDDDRVRAIEFGLDIKVMGPVIKHWPGIVQENIHSHRLNALKFL